MRRCMRSRGLPVESSKLLKTRSYRWQTKLGSILKTKIPPMNLIRTTSDDASCKWALLWCSCQCSKTSQDVSCDVWESCLSHDWGYGYLFRFGKNLQRDTDGMSSAEKRIPNISIEHLSDESVDEMRLLLKSSAADMTRLKEIQAMFQCFEKHLNYVKCENQSTYTTN
jgi:hypothetical protein